MFGFLGAGVLFGVCSFEDLEKEGYGAYRRLFGGDND